MLLSLTGEVASGRAFAPVRVRARKLRGLYETL